MCLANNPNIYMYSLYADLSKRRSDIVTPYVIMNLNTTENLYIWQNHIIAFAEKDDTDGKIFEIEQLDTTPRNWVPQWTFMGFAQVDVGTELHKVLKSWRCKHKGGNEGKFYDLCDQFDNIISKGSDHIGKTLLVEMDIDMGIAHQLLPDPTPFH